MACDVARCYAGLRAVDESLDSVTRECVAISVGRSCLADRNHSSDVGPIAVEDGTTVHPKEVATLEDSFGARAADAAVIVSTRVNREISGSVNAMAGKFNGPGISDRHLGYA